MRPQADDRALIQELARRALVNIAREYPHHCQHVLRRDEDAVPPRVLHPAFFGCFDWHSAVHSHWLLVRALRVTRDADLRRDVVAALGHALDSQKLAVEAAYLGANPSFERPYGLAWTLQLAAETSICEEPAAAVWSRALEPLHAAARVNVTAWLARLRYPVRSGTHNQTAFALGMILDSARTAGDEELERAVSATALALFSQDADAPLKLEPSGEDFLSPTLMEADLLRRVLAPLELAAWLHRFLPALPSRDDHGWLPCAQVSDETDGKAVHLHGLNLSRAWSLRNIAAALPAGDPRASVLAAASERHRRAGLEATLAATDYAATHWLPTFAVYLLEQPAK